MTLAVITGHENDSVLDVARVFKANNIAGAPGIAAVYWSEYF